MNSFFFLNIKIKTLIGRPNRNGLKKGYLRDKRKLKSDKFSTHSTLYIHHNYHHFKEGKHLEFCRPLCEMPLNKFIKC